MWECALVSHLVIRTSEIPGHRECVMTFRKVQWLHIPRFPRFPTFHRRGKVRVIYVGRKPLSQVRMFAEAMVKAGAIKVGLTQIVVEHDAACMYPQGLELCICDPGPTIRIEEP